MIKKTIQIGNPIIRKKSKTVANIKNRTTMCLIKDLIDSMRANELVGMAAPQIGVNLRVFVTELRKTKIRRNFKDLDSVRVFINPRIISSSSNQTTLYEGCGSLAHAQLFGPVRRPTKVSVEALNERGENFRITATGLLAKVIQHELDHLEGIVCIDRFTDSKKIMCREEYISHT
jgi:peptide deformylase